MTCINDSGSGVAYPPVNERFTNLTVFAPSISNIPRLPLFCFISVFDFTPTTVTSSAIVNVEISNVPSPTDIVFPPPR